MIPILKDKKSKSFPPQQPSQEQPSRAPAKKNILPLKEFYLDDTHHYSGKLEICWLSGDKITIKSDRGLIFGPFDVRVNALSLTVSTFILPFANIFTDVTSTSIMAQISPLSMTQYSSWRCFPAEGGLALRPSAWQSDWIVVVRVRKRATQT